MTRKEYLRRYKRYLLKCIKKVDSLLLKEYKKDEKSQRRIERR